MSMRCPDGHVSESTDYCDVCGLPMDAAPAATAAQPVQPTQMMPTDKACPNCQSIVPEADLFCEVCGYDFTTGALPAPATAPSGLTIPPQQIVTQPPPDPSPPTPMPTSVTWVAEVWVDPDWFSTQESDESMPSAGMPEIRPLWDTSVLVGRKSVSRNIHPQIDCGNDHGVSRRHAQLTTDGQRWWAEDLQSSNGTFLSPAGAPLPSQPIPAGQRVEFAPGDRVFVGAWTRIVIRKATSDGS